MSDDYVQQTDGARSNDAPSCGCGAGFLCVIGYVFGWLSGLIIALVEANSYFVVFHACQSIVISIIYCLFAIVFALIDNLVIQPGGLNFSITSFIWFVLYLILIIVCCIFAVKNQESGDLFQLVLVGGLAEKMADKFFNAKYKRTRVKEVDEW